jgi:hypothetical protein
MSDNEIMSLPDWDIAFDDSIEQFKIQNRKEPTLLELQNIIEILVKRFHELGYLIEPRQKRMMG